MQGNFDSLSRWCQQAHQHIEEGAGNQLVELDEHKDLVPLKEESSTFWPFSRKRKVALHGDDVKNVCKELVQEANQLAEMAGLEQRPASKLDSLNWEKMTIIELAENLDGLLATTPVLLLNARQVLRRLLHCCRGYSDGSLPRSSLDREFEQFSRTLESIFHQLAAESPENLSRFTGHLARDISDAQQKILTNTDSAAEELQIRFDRIINRLTRVQTSQSAGLDEIKQDIQAATRNSSPEQVRYLCQKAVSGLEQYFQTSLMPDEEQFDQLNELINWLIPVLEIVYETSPEHYRIMDENLLLPLTTIRENLTAQIHPFEDSVVVLQEEKSTPVKRISQQELLDSGLVADSHEYEELGKLIHAELLSHPDIIPVLTAFGHLQQYNQGLSYQSMAQLAEVWPGKQLVKWAERTNNSSQSTTPYYLMLPDVTEAIAGLAQAQHIPQHIADIIPMLDMNGLSAPYLLEQLQSLEHLFPQPDDPEFNPSDIAYALNQNILTPRKINLLITGKESISALFNRIEQCRYQARQRVIEYETNGVSELTRSRFGLMPYSVPVDQDSLYYAIGHVMGEPMRQVRQRCHQTAEDILALSQKRYRGDLSTPYAGRLTKAARTMDLKQLEHLVNRGVLLFSASESPDPAESEGLENYLPLVSIAYDCSTAALMAGSYYQVQRGYLPDGSEYESSDTVKHLVQLPEAGPLLMIHDGRCWSPLVKAT